jgi:hypothetical protein
MLTTLLRDFAIAFLIVIGAMGLFGDSFLVGWIAYIVYDFTRLLVTAALKERKDETK